tara:strand:- start:205 stop:387 length:183 start_codon:yes stop_codon:yes gene_type:complete
MPNHTKYNSRLLRASEPAAPAARNRTRAIGTVNPYWIQQAQKRKAASLKRQAASNKRLDK